MAYGVLCDAVWRMVYDMCCVTHGVCMMCNVCCVARGVWHGVLCVLCDACCLAHGVLYVLCDAWCVVMVYDVCFMVHGV